MTKIETQEQLIQVLLLCREFLAESRYGALALNPNKMSFVIQTAQAHPERFYADYKFNDDGECVGMFIGRVEELIFADALIASEVLFYVREDYRGSPWFIRTLRAFENWSKDNGAICIKLSPNAGINADANPRLYERLGYTQVGHIFNKEF